LFNCQLSNHDCLKVLKSCKSSFRLVSFHSLTSTLASSSHSPFSPLTNSSTSLVYNLTICLHRCTRVDREGQRSSDWH
jgi:hypothetical protein